MPKKVGNIVKGLGPRYGSTLRKRLQEVLAQSRAAYPCPRCGVKAVKRKAIGIWSCRKCGYTFAGKAYSPS